MEKWLKDRSYLVLITCSSIPELVYLCPELYTHTGVMEIKFGTSLIRRTASSLSSSDSDPGNIY